MTGLSEQVRTWIAAPNFWHLSTVNQDGSPHLSPMWIDVEGGYIVFNTAVGRVKKRTCAVIRWFRCRVWTPTAHTTGS